MKLGVCTSPDQMATVYACGYDYIEANFTWLNGLSDEDYRANTALVEASPIKVEAFNCFFPGGFSLYAADGDQTDIPQHGFTVDIHDVIRFDIPVDDIV